MSVVEVRGWMAESERLFLRKLSFGCRVLELGCFEGLSTVNIAATARSVVAVDSFEGTGTVHEGSDTERAMRANLANAGIDNVTVIRGFFSDVLIGLHELFDVIFIDGSHDYESVVRDIALSLRLLARGGVLAFHDYDNDHPGVVQAVNELSGFHPIGQDGSLVALRQGEASEPREAVVALVMPHRNLECNLGAAAGLHFASNGKLRQVVSNFGTSVLTQCFNTLLAEALNARETDGVTHFAMLHNDVIPGRFWLDMLFEEMQSGGYDMVSTVVPIKNHKGLTSTGIDTPGNPWSVRRLTMSEVYDLPETFTAQDIPFRADESQLLCNTGCWLMRLDQPWVDGLHFRQQDRIAWSLSEQKYAAQSISEDWDFSRQLVGRGCRIAATRRVPIQHERPEFHNKSAWGEWTSDEAYLQNERLAAETCHSPTTK